MNLDEPLRLSLLTIHRRVILLGSQRIFYILLILLVMSAGTLAYFSTSVRMLIFIITLFCVGSLYNSYFIELPALKKVLAFFETNHPEVCSWLPESPLLEAQKMSDRK